MNPKKLLLLPMSINTQHNTQFSQYILCLARSLSLCVSLRHLLTFELYARDNTNYIWKTHIPFASQLLKGKHTKAQPMSPHMCSTGSPFITRSLKWQNGKCDRHIPWDDCEIKIECSTISKSPTINKKHSLEYCLLGVSEGIQINPTQNYQIDTVMR